jgi:hypothetical protein
MLVVSEDTSTVTRTTTRFPAQSANKGKVIAGAVAGSVGGVALLGGLLGGLLTTATTAPPKAIVTSTFLPTANATASPTEVNIMADASPSRFLLRGHAPVAKSLHAALAHHLGSPWGAVLTFCCLSAVAGIAVVGAEFKSRRQGSQDASGAGENADSTDDSTDDERGRSGPDAVGLADQNHDRVRSREEFNAAFGVTTFAWNLVPASSAWHRVVPS